MFRNHIYNIYVSNDFALILWRNSLLMDSTTLHKYRKTLQYEDITRSGSSGFVPTFKKRKKKNLIEIKSLDPETNPAPCVVMRTSLPSYVLVTDLCSCKYISILLQWSSILFLFVAVSHQTGLDTRSKFRRPIKVRIKGRGRSGTSQDSNPAGLCCSSAHLMQCEPDEASSFTDPIVGLGTYTGLWLELDSKV